MEVAREKTYVQCLNCGHIHTIRRKISMENAIIKSFCPKCGYKKVLNCGYNEMDLMELQDPYLNGRYFSY